MQHLDTSPVRHTSVTLRVETRRLLKRAIALLASNNLKFSEQRLMRECLRLALRLWRGNGATPRRNKCYNRKIFTYEIVPFYSTEALRSVATLRAHHSGISLSRLMDLAIRLYLDRVVERCLSFSYQGREDSDVALWSKKLAKRRHIPNFIISYSNHARRTDALTVEYLENMKFLPWPPPRTEFRL